MSHRHPGLDTARQWRCHESGIHQRSLLQAVKGGQRRCPYCRGESETSFSARLAISCKIRPCVPMSCQWGAGCCSAPCATLLALTTLLCGGQVLAAAQHHAPAQHAGLAAAVGGHHLLRPGGALHPAEAPPVLCAQRAQAQLPEDRPSTPLRPPARVSNPPTPPLCACRLGRCHILSCSAPAR